MLLRAAVLIAATVCALIGPRTYAQSGVYEGKPSATQSSKQWPKSFKRKPPNADSAARKKWKRTRSEDVDTVTKQTEASQ